MKRKKHGLIGKALAAALALAMCLPIGVSAAEGDGAISGTETIPPDIKITQYFEMPEGEVLSTSTVGSLHFEYKFEGSEGAPAISSKYVNINYNNPQGANGAVEQICDGETITKRYLNTTKDSILKGVKFTSPGIFNYNVTLDAEKSVKGKGNAVVTHSTETYTMKVWVEEKADQSGFYARSVVITDSRGEKVDPANGGFVFTSTFSDGLGAPAAGTLKITNNSISGKYADKNKSFIYIVKLAKKVGYNYQGELTIKENGEPAVISYEKPLTITLKMGETVTLEAPFGTLFNVEAAAEPDYQHKYEKLVDGVSKTSQSGAFGRAFDITIESGVKEGSAVHSELEVKWNHIYDDSAVPTPMGAIINNFPFIMLIVVAAVGMALCAILKKKRY